MQPDGMFLKFFTGSKRKKRRSNSSSPEPPAFISINRGHSFYGKVVYDATAKELYLQAELDSDPVNRYLAFMTIMDREKVTMLTDPSASPDPACIDLYMRLLQTAT